MSGKNHNNVSPSSVNAEYAAMPTKNVLRVNRLSTTVALQVDGWNSIKCNTVYKRDAPKQRDMVPVQGPGQCDCHDYRSKVNQRSTSEVTAA